jgi:tRNA (cytidine32/uridine32-2'-O)-methyltransferase
MLQNVRIVLVDTSHPGNIGAAARAMKNMCLSRLYLVTPHKFPHAEATSRASGADDLLGGATVCDSLDEALAGCSLIIGASARLRRLSAPPLGPRPCAERVVQGARDSEVALVFGREHSGLTNEELSRCHYLMHIPCNPEYSSLNVAAAVQIMAYEVMLASGVEEDLDNEARGQGAPVPSEEMERLFEHMQEALVEIDFLDPDNPRIMMRRLRRLFNRARPNKVEYNILRGILTAAQRHHR